MFILYAIPAGILAGLAMGGRLDGLSRLQFRWAWVFMLGLAVQLVLFSDAVTQRIGDAGMPIYVLSTLAVAVAVAANVRVTGIPILLAGAVSNLAAIVANGGYMPASPEALAALGRPVKEGYSNSSFVTDPALPWLTDIFAMPSWMPFTNVFSVGDVLIGLGVVVVIAAAMRAPARPAGAHGNNPAPDPAAPTSAAA
jgi:hypothetical protein